MQGNEVDEQIDDMIDVIEEKFSELFHEELIPFLVQQYNALIEAGNDETVVYYYISSKLDMIGVRLAYNSLLAFDQLKQAE